MSPFACPNCQHHVHLPEGVAPNATVQCPMCGHTTQVSQLSQSVGPTWIVLEPGDGSPVVSPVVSPAESLPLVANAAMPSEESRTQGSDQASILSSGSMDGLRPALGEEMLPKADRTRKQPLKQQDWTKHKPLSHDEYQRRKRKSSSPLQGILQVVLGGALALPIAQLLIWHVLGKDPFQLAPKVGAYAPWIVPYRFRPYPADAVERGAYVPAANSKSKSGSGIGRDFDAELAQSLAESEREVVPSRETAPRSEAAPATVELDETRQPETPKTQDKSPSQAKVPAENETRPAESSLSESEKLTQAIAATRDAIQAWSKIAKDNAAERRKVANLFYSSLAMTVEQFAKLAEEPSARIRKHEMEKLMRDIRQDAELLQLVRAGGFAKLNKQGEKLPAGVGLAFIARWDASEEPTALKTTEDGASEAEASDRKLWTILVRKSLIAEATETPENTHRREVVLHRDVRLGEDVTGDYFILSVTPVEASAAAGDVPPDNVQRDVVWFAMPIL